MRPSWLPHCEQGGGRFEWLVVLQAFHHVREHLNNAYIVTTQIFRLCLGDVSKVICETKIVSNLSSGAFRNAHECTVLPW